MKKLIILLFALFAIGVSQSLEAKGVIVYHNGPTFKSTHDLPADEMVDGKHVNFGVAFEQFGIFWLPVWNYGEVQYALVTDDGENAWALDAEQVAEYKAEYNLDIDDSPSIPFWQKIGLKPLILLLLGWFVCDKLFGKKK